ncbi:MAG TPA: SpoIIE family protein phosphatase, partial [Clostridia bacterium]|nr:SpoIIE family protein phosphatase [Clostridia bacterium]
MFVSISSSDSLLVYTDGVTEAMNSAGELFGEQRLKYILHDSGGGTAQEEVRHVLAKTREFVNGAVQSDDITILALEYLRRVQ